jgi:hypothetical protein
VNNDTFEDPAIIEAELVAALVPVGQAREAPTPTPGRTRFADGTYSIGYVHPAIDWVVPGVYKGRSRIDGHHVFIRLHNGFDEKTEVVKHTSGRGDVLMAVCDATFVTASGGEWVYIAPLPPGRDVP